jgi:mannonate dehydratase
MANSRREFLKKGASLAALSAAIGLGAGACTTNRSDSSNSSQPDDFDLNASVNWPVTEREDTPKIAMGGGGSEEGIRRIKQMGVTHVMSSVGGNPWTVEDVSEIKDHLEANGLVHCQSYIGGIDDVIYGRDGAEEQIENFKQSLRAAGEAGLAMVEYNWYAHRLTEGYYEMEGRGGSGYTAYDYDRVKDLPPRPEVGTHTAEELWDRYTYFLNEVVPVAEEAGVRMLVHPNDPPAPQSRGNDQILATFDDWKRLLNIVESPYNGMTCHSGVTRELGIDPVEVARYMGERDQINHVHYRNVIVEEAPHKYAEVFPDNGESDMFAFMRELIRQGYTGAIHPEHPRAIDYDRTHPEGISGQYADVGGGGHAGMIYNLAYTRAMLQAALIAEGKV